MTELAALLVPLQERIEALPEAEQEAARPLVADAIARALVHRAMTEESVYARIIPGVPVAPDRVRAAISLSVLDALMLELDKEDPCSASPDSPS